MKSLLSKKHGKRKELSIDFLVDLWEKQKGLCAISGIPMTYIAGKGRVNTNVSLDQIVPNAGYTEENVQLVTFMANRMKDTLNMNELIELCENILKHNKKEN